MVDGGTVTGRTVRMVGVRVWTVVVVRKLHHFGGHAIVAKAGVRAHTRWIAHD